MNQHWQDLYDETVKFVDWCNAKVRSVIGAITQSDDAGAVGGVDYDTLMAEVQMGVNAHAAKKGAANPHGITADKANTYPKTTVDAALANKLQWPQISMSQYGDMDTTTLGATGSGLVLTFTKPQPVMLAGMYAVLPVQSFTLTNNTMAYFYVRLKDNQLAYVMSTTLLPESNNLMWIGYALSSGGIWTISIRRVTRLNTFRIWPNPYGSCIPVTTQALISPGKLAAGWRAGS